MVFSDDDAPIITETCFFDKDFISPCQQNLDYAGQMLWDRKHSISSVQLVGWGTPIGTADDFNGLTPNPYAPGQLCLYADIAVGVVDIDIDFVRVIEDTTNEFINFNEVSLVILSPRRITSYAYLVLTPNFGIAQHKAYTYRPPLVLYPTTSIAQKKAYNYSGIIEVKPTSRAYQKSTLTLRSILELYPTANVVSPRYLLPLGNLVMFPTANVVSINNYLPTGILELRPTTNIVSQRNVTLTGILEMLPIGNVGQHSTQLPTGNIVCVPTTNIRQHSAYEVGGDVVMVPTANISGAYGVQVLCCGDPIPNTLCCTVIVPTMEDEEIDVTITFQDNLLDEHGDTLPYGCPTTFSPVNGWYGYVSGISWASAEEEGEPCDGVLKVWIYCVHNIEDFGEFVVMMTGFDTPTADQWNCVGDYPTSCLPFGWTHDSCPVQNCNGSTDVDITIAPC